MQSGADLCMELGVVHHLVARIKFYIRNKWHPKSQNDWRCHSWSAKIPCTTLGIEALHMRSLSFLFVNFSYFLHLKYSLILYNSNFIIYLYCIFTFFVFFWMFVFYLDGCNLMIFFFYPYNVILLIIIFFIVMHQRHNIILISYMQMEGVYHIFVYA